MFHWYIVLLILLNNLRKIINFGLIIASVLYMQIKFISPKLNRHYMYILAKEVRLYHVSFGSLNIAYHENQFILLQL